MQAAKFVQPDFRQQVKAGAEKLAQLYQDAAEFQGSRHKTLGPLAVAFLGASLDKPFAKDAALGLLNENINQEIAKKTDNALAPGFHGSGWIFLGRFYFKVAHQLLNASK